MSRDALLDTLTDELTGMLLDALTSQRQGSEALLWLRGKQGRVRELLRKAFAAIAPNEQDAVEVNRMFHGIEPTNRPARTVPASTNGEK